MAYQDLREFVRALEKNNELKRIPFEVDPRLEITEFADRAVKQGGPALLFERPTGFKIPVLVNAFASMRKMEIALEVNSVEEVARRIVEFLEMRMPEGLIGKLKMLPKLAEMGAFFPTAPIPAKTHRVPADRRSVRQPPRGSSPGFPRSRRSRVFAREPCGQSQPGCGASAGSRQRRNGPGSQLRTLCRRPAAGKPHEPGP